MSNPVTGAVTLPFCPHKVVYLTGLGSPRKYKGPTSLFTRYRIRFPALPYIHHTEAQLPISSRMGTWCSKQFASNQLLLIRLEWSSFYEVIPLRCYDVELWETTVALLAAKLSTKVHTSVHSRRCSSLSLAFLCVFWFTFFETWDSRGNDLGVSPYSW
jgi:hypothetical protein